MNKQLPPTVCADVFSNHLHAKLASNHVIPSDL